MGSSLFRTRGRLFGWASLLILPLVFVSSTGRAAFFVDGHEVEATTVDPTLTYVDGPRSYPSCAGDLAGTSDLKMKRDVPGRGPLEFRYDPTVFMGHPIYGYRVLEAAIREMKGHADGFRVLVLGTGCGFEAIALAKTFPRARIEATDISADAIRYTERNARRHGVHRRVRAYPSDVFEHVRGTYDLIVFNAPRPVMPGDLKQDRILNTGFFDRDGSILRRLLGGTASRLAAGGRLLLMSDQSLRVPLPLELSGRVVSTDPWVEYHPDDGLFSIHRIERSR